MSSLTESNIYHTTYFTVYVIFDWVKNLPCLPYFTVCALFNSSYIICQVRHCTVSTKPSLTHGYSACHVLVSLSRLLPCLHHPFGVHRGDELSGTTVPATFEYLFSFCFTVYNTNLKLCAVNWVSIKSLPCSSLFLLIAFAGGNDLFIRKVEDHISS